MNSPLTTHLFLAQATSRTVAAPRREPWAVGLAGLVVAAGLAGCSHTPEVASTTSPVVAPALVAAPAPAPAAPAPVATVAPAKAVVKIKPARAVPTAPVIAPATAPIPEEVAPVPAPVLAPSPAPPTTRTQAGRILD